MLKKQILYNKQQDLSYQIINFYPPYPPQRSLNVKSVQIIIIQMQTNCFSKVQTETQLTETLNKKLNQQRLIYSQAIETLHAHNIMHIESIINIFIQGKSEKVEFPTHELSSQKQTNTSCFEISAIFTQDEKQMALDLIKKYAKTFQSKTRELVLDIQLQRNKNQSKIKNLTMKLERQQKQFLDLNTDFQKMRSLNFETIKQLKAEINEEKVKYSNMKIQNKQLSVATDIYEYYIRKFNSQRKQQNQKIHSFKKEIQMLKTVNKTQPIKAAFCFENKVVESEQDGYQFQDSKQTNEQMICLSFLFATEEIEQQEVQNEWNLQEKQVQMLKQADWRFE